MILEDLGSLH